MGPQDQARGAWKIQQPLGFDCLYTQNKTFMYKSILNMVSTKMEETFMAE
jgi:hypothetical protein